MQPNLKAYTINKISSLGSILVLIALSWLWLGYGETQWQMILMFLIAFGYAHFLIGFFYQGKSFFRKQNTWQHFITFGVLVVFSLLLTELLFSYLGYALTLFIGFVYFLLHGLFNEQTLIQREGGTYVPLMPIFSLAIFVMTLLTYSVPDPTFLFNRQLEFANLDTFTFIRTFDLLKLNLDIFPNLFWGGIVLSFLMLGISWIKHRNHRLSSGLALSYVLILLAVVTWGAPPYVYMYFLVVGYHFMTWFLFFLRTMSVGAKKTVHQFLFLHILVLVPFLIGGVLFFKSDSSIALFLFDYKYFVVTTYVHITTSFMNDQWFQTIQSKVFNFRLGKV